MCTPVRPRAISIRIGIRTEVPLRVASAPVFELLDEEQRRGEAPGGAGPGAQPLKTGPAPAAAGRTGRRLPTEADPPLDRQRGTQAESPPPSGSHGEFH